MIDGKLYREAFEQLDRWNEAELIARASQNKKLSSTERWQQYESLWRFCLELAGPPSDISLRLRYWDWVDYYLKLQRFEIWRQKNAARVEVTAT
jgi:hypothetical protein